MRSSKKKAKENWEEEEDNPETVKGVKSLEEGEARCDDPR